MNLARAIKCLDVFGRHDPERAEFYAKKYYEDMSMAREFKAMSATNPTAGGFLIRKSIWMRSLNCCTARPSSRNWAHAPFRWRTAT